MCKTFYITLSLLIFLFFSCNTRKNYIPSKISLSYWNLDNGDSTIQAIIHHFGENDVYEEYYKNGGLKSRALYSGSSLIEIYSVYDKQGKELKYGSLKVGNGHVIVYDDESVRKYEGNYVNGSREAWWVEFDFRGNFSDSVFYKNGELPDIQGVKFNKY